MLCSQQRGKILRKDTAGARIEAERPQWALGKRAEDPLLNRNIVFSDEAHFWLNVYVNKQNCRFWSEDQPEELQKLPMHLEKVTVWCGLWAGGIIGSYFFKDAEKRNITMNGRRYRGMISNFFFAEFYVGVFEKLAYSS